MTEIEAHKGMREQVRLAREWPRTIPRLGMKVILLILALVACAEQPSKQPLATPIITRSSRHNTPEATLPSRLQRRSVPSMASITITDPGEEEASYRRPALLAAQLIGRDLATVSLIGGQFQDSGDGRVLLYQTIDPDPLDEEWPGTWLDGIHELAESWDFSGDYLADSQSGDFVLLWTTDPQGSTRTVHGRFRSVGEEQYHDSVLILDIESGGVEDVIEIASGTSLSAAEGDEFQLTNLVLDSRNSLRSEPGISLFFEEGGQLSYDRRPLPSGSYFFGFSAESDGGTNDTRFTSYRVDNEAVSADYRTFVDPRRGFQFPYPATWRHSADYAGSHTFRAPSGQTQLRITTHPEMADHQPADLQRTVLEAYGDVAVLYEDQIQIGITGGLRTIYGYESAEGPRMGVLLTFAQDGRAFVLDLDGPAADEAYLLELTGMIAESWTLRSVDLDQGERWTEMTLNELPVIVPADYRYRKMNNGWHHFTGANGQIFFALRGESTAGQGLFDRLTYWQEVAAEEVEEFAASSAYVVEIGGLSWARLDFEYASSPDEKTNGAILLTKIGERFLLYWYEAPANDYQQLEDELFLVVAEEFGQKMAH